MRSQGSLARGSVRRSASTDMAAVVVEEGNLRLRVQESQEASRRYWRSQCRRLHRYRVARRENIFNIDAVGWPVESELAIADADMDMRNRATASIGLAGEKICVFNERRKC